MAADDTEELRKYNKLYLEIIMRYHNYIDENEHIYVAELPRLVMPKDDAVVVVANGITSGFTQYNYDKEFHEAAKLAYEYVRDKIANIMPPVQFWLNPSQTIEIGAGDEFDKVTLLCSLLIALGNVSAKIIITVEDAKKTTGVYCEYSDRIIYIDMEKGPMDLENKSGLLQRLGINEGSNMTAYEFNDRMYNDLM